MTTDRDELSMWTIYDHPADHPAHVVVREWTTGPPPSSEFEKAAKNQAPPHVVRARQPTRRHPALAGRLLVFEDLDGARRAMRARGLVPLPRHPRDDPNIVETWI